MPNDEFIESLRAKLEAHATLQRLAEATVNAHMLFWARVLKALPSQYVQAA